MKKSIYIAIISLLLTNNANALQRVGFSPSSVCKDNIIELIHTAKHSIDFAIFTFTDIDIANALHIAHSHGIEVNFVYDKSQAKSKHSQVEYLLDAEINGKPGKTRGLMHNKYIIIDNKILLTGSFNWTKNAVRSNNENCIVLDDAEIVSSFVNNFKGL